MTALDLSAVRERYTRALSAKPSKGPYTEAGITALYDSACDVPDLLAHIARLTEDHARIYRALYVAATKTRVQLAETRGQLSEIKTQRDERSAALKAENARLRAELADLAQLPMGGDAA